MIQNRVRIRYNVVLGFITKISSVALTLISVPILLDILGKYKYGMWITLTSVMAWLGFFDIGIGNGLRNQLTTAFTQNDIRKAKALISTAYLGLGAILVLAIIIFLSTNLFINWNSLFNIDKGFSRETIYSFNIIIVLFLLRLLANLIIFILSANHKTGISGVIDLVTNIAFLIILILVKYLQPNIQEHLNIFILLVSSYSIIPLLTLAAFSIYYFFTLYKPIAPSFSSFKKESLGGLFGLGFKFFVLQLFTMLIYSLGPVLISNLASPEEVTHFGIAIRYFTPIIIVLSIIRAPLWSAFGEQYLKGNNDWIRNKIQVLNRLTLLLSIGMVLMIIFSQQVFDIWLGKKIVVPYKMTTLVAIFIFLQSWLGNYTQFINGIGKIRLILILVVIFGALNIPLSIFFSKWLNMGADGVILSMIICVFPLCLSSTVQTNLILLNRHSGIWSK